MTDEPTNLVLEHLRAIRASQARVEQTLAEHGERLTAIELAMAGMRREHAVDAEAGALLGVRVDRISDRVARLERRLELADAPPH